MFIKKIILENFRIYKGVTEISFEADDRRNVHIISGYNGYGKTTLLTSLVWCLYGGHMQDVDDSFKRRIREAGGYSKFLEGCLNRASLQELERKYSVSIHLTNLKISGIVAGEVEIRRTYTIGEKTDVLEIYLDGQKNGLVQDVGNDIFIQDFILPKEIAKFFFFDAEKITSLAENQSIEEKKQLGKAYSEVLGIKKYVDLRTSLVDLRLKYKKESASLVDVAHLNRLELEIENLAQEIEQLEHKKNLLKSRIRENDEQIVIFQTKLWRIGTTLNFDELNKLRERKDQLQEVSDELKTNFKTLLEYAPFAIAGNLFFSSVSLARLEIDLSKRISTDSIRTLSEQFQSVLSSFPEAITKQAVISSLSPILQQLNLLSLLDTPITSDTRLNLSEETFNEMEAIEKLLKFTYKEQFKRLSKEIKRNRYELNEVSKKLLQAKSKENDNSVKHLQMKLDSVITSKQLSTHEFEDILAQSSVLHNELNNRKKVLSEFQKKLDVKEDFQVKDEIAIRLIAELDQFILDIQKEKQHLLEDSICKGLNRLMHKKHFIKLVTIRIEGEVISIELIGENGDKISKEDLSMGEKQLYATAVFQALVKESKIDFPVFIDSPMQKLDVSHSENILSEFYPNVSKQVVILPLLNKEISPIEYQIIENFVKSCHLIVHNTDEESSSVVRISNNELFTHIPVQKINV